MAPDAPVRILLTAAPEVRAARRSAELTTQDAASVAEALHRRDASDSQVVDFLTAAPGVTVVDSTDLDFNQTVAAVLGVVREVTDRSRTWPVTKSTKARPTTSPRSSRTSTRSSPNSARRRSRVSLGDYELEDEDAALLAGVQLGEDGIEYLPALPVVAIVGRPNVGKSALVNRILGRREAVVEDTPGVTRDRVTYKAEWMDRRFTIVDTGGWEPDARGIDRSVAAQAEVAIDLCDVVIFVVDAMVGATSTDEHVVKLLRKSGKPVFLVANKIDDARHEPEAAALWNLGLGEPYPVSAIHGRGVADLLDEIMKVLPEISAVAKQEIGGPRRVAILGRPNVGKSSLLNKAAGEERVVVNELAGTTRDPVDEIVELNGRLWRFVDTAGIRRRVHLQQGADFYASLRTSAALEKAEVAVVVLDVSRAASASRTSASSTSSSSRAARSCSRSTSGIA